MSFKLVRHVCALFIFVAVFLAVMLWRGAPLAQAAPPAAIGLLTVTSTAALVPPLISFIVENTFQHTVRAEWTTVPLTISWSFSSRTAAVCGTVL